MSEPESELDVHLRFLAASFDSSTEHQHVSQSKHLLSARPQYNILAQDMLQSCERILELLDYSSASALRQKHAQKIARVCLRCLSLQNKIPFNHQQRAGYRTIDQYHLQQQMLGEKRLKWGGEAEAYSRRDLASHARVLWQLKAKKSRTCPASAEVSEATQYDTIGEDTYGYEEVPARICVTSERD